MALKTTIYLRANDPHTPILGLILASASFIHVPKVKVLVIQSLSDSLQPHEL